MKNIILFLVELFYSIFKPKSRAVAIVVDSGKLETTYVRPPDIMPEIQTHYPVIGSPIYLGRHVYQTYRGQQRAAKKRRRAK